MSPGNSPTCSSHTWTFSSGTCTRSTSRGPTRRRSSRSAAGPREARAERRPRRLLHDPGAAATARTGRRSSTRQPARASALRERPANWSTGAPEQTPQEIHGAGPRPDLAIFAGSDQASARVYEIDREKVVVQDGQRMVEGD